MFRPAWREQHSYDARRNEIRIRDLGVSGGELWKSIARAYPLTVSDLLKVIEESGAAAPTVKERVEDGLLRFDVELAVPAGATQPTTGRATLPSKGTLWADRRTKLIAKLQYDSAGATKTFRFTYGAPDIGDLYDLGVPRDARIIDNRIRGDEIGYLAKLQERVDHGFGDGVAVLTELEVGADGKPTTSRATIHLFARAGASMFAGRYLVGPSRDVDAGSRVSLPANWPNPSPEDVVRSLRDAMPTSFLVSDGEQAWQGSGVSPTQMQIRPVDLKMPEAMQQSRSMADLGGMIWPTRYSLGVFGRESGFNLLGDTKRPNLIGVGVDQMVQLDPATKRRTVREHWLDRGRDNVPVEVTWLTYGPDLASVALKFHAKYDEPQQLPTGLWYPPKWRQTSSGSLLGRETSSELTLRIYPALTIDSAWFRNPADRVKVP
jgi:hypothetical protein